MLDKARIAASLRARGFTEAQIAQAFADFQRFGTGDPVEVERLASFRLLGLPEEEIPQLISWQMTMTRYHNWRIGGLGQRIAGWGLTAGGVLGVGMGGLMYMVGQTGCAPEGDPYRNDEPRPDYVDDGERVCRTTFDILAALYGVTGMVLLAVGVPMLSTGTAKTDRWAPDALLDIGTTEEMEPYRLPEGEAVALPFGASGGVPMTGTGQGAATLRLGLAPWTPAAGGLGLALSLGF